jgi:TolA-binding protein
MKNNFLYRQSLLLFILCLFLLGSKSHEIADIEAALIKQDYPTVNRLAEYLISKQPERNIRNQAQYYLGISGIRLGQYQDARENFNKIIADRFAEPMLLDKAYLGLFDAYYYEEKYDEALAVGMKHLKASPRSDFLSALYLKLARVNLKLAKWQDAYEYLLKITQDLSYSFDAYTAKQLLEEKHYFAVQVGAFAERSAAEKLIDELKKKNEYAYIVETTDQQGKKFYRVRVGELSYLDQARELKKKLSLYGYPTQIYP